MTLNNQFRLTSWPRSRIRASVKKKHQGIVKTVIKTVNSSLLVHLKICNDEKEVLQFQYLKKKFFYHVRFCMTKCIAVEISSKSMAQYGLFVLKVSLNSNQSIEQKV